MTKEEYHFFLNHRLKQHCILGNDYYMTNEHRVFADGHTESSGEVFGYSEITRQYYNRYRLPVMHTETNMKEGKTGQEAVQWLWKEWANVLGIRNVGIPTVGWGEASLEGWAEAVDGAFEALKDRFLGHDPFRIEDIWQVGYRGGFYRGGPVMMSAIAGLDQALWDLKGRAVGLPAYEMLGGR